MAITGCKIHPAIGVARVGDSPDGYFIGPERPGIPARPGDGLFKDAAGRIKRQAARFRIFGYDEHGEVVREIKADEAEISWTVHLANRKAAAERFRQSANEPKIRNELVPEQDRGGLVIDPGQLEIVAGRAADTDARPAAGFFTVAAEADPVAVTLGELRTDEDGRLLVLGGHGVSHSPGDTPLTHFADNNGWYDDTSDGPVRATVRLKGSKAALEADPSWVVVAPPDYAPSIGNVVTLLDVVEQAAADARGLADIDEVYFDRDIQPLLNRVIANQWVHETVYRGHRRGDQDPEDATAVERGGDFSDQALLKQLADPDPKAEAIRKHVFRKIRPPQPVTDEQATASLMPPFSGDGGDRREGVPETWLSVTPRQYRRLMLWADGEFAPRAPASAASPEPTADDLDRAALENCVGGGFFPGIEVSGRIKDPALYDEDASHGFRLNPDGLEAGALTERMAVPWQADFTQCEGFWWPAQRPDHVVTEEDYAEVVAERPQPAERPGPQLDTLAYPRRAWARGVGGPAGDVQARMRDMVDRWRDLGFVVPRGDDDPQVRVETERNPYLELSDRDYFHLLLNIDEHPDFRRFVPVLARRFFDDAERRIDHDPTLDSELHPIHYDEVAFDTRLTSIYQFLADQVAAYRPVDEATFQTKKAVIERIRQYGPLNLTDGYWLRGIDSAKPRPGVTDNLRTILADENGGGVEKFRHSFVYAELMRGVGLDPAPVESLAYAEDPTLLESAFTQPVLQLAVAECTEEFFPEVLGMTLYFEWESVWLMYVVKLFEHYEIDSWFYRLHLAIDNVAEGHGAMATRAVRTYLTTFAYDDERQRQWRRIWRGYVAFRESGTLFGDLKKLVLHPPEIKARMLAMIERKKPFANLNHGGSAIMSNDLFDDPEHLLDVLANNPALVTPGKPDESGLLDLFAIDGGRMYKVFTEEEQELWKEWIRSLLHEPPPEPVPAPLPPAPHLPGPPRHFRRLTFASPQAAFDADPRKLRGAGGLQ